MVSRVSSLGLSPLRRRGPTCAWSSRASGRISSKPTRAPSTDGSSSLQTWSRPWRGQTEVCQHNSPSFIKASGLRRRNGHEEERVAEKQVSFSADRRENQRARRLAGLDAQPAPSLNPTNNHPERRGTVVEEGLAVGRGQNDPRRPDVQ